MLGHLLPLLALANHLLNVCIRNLHVLDGAQTLDALEQGRENDASLRGGGNSTSSWEYGKATCGIGSSTTPTNAALGFLLCTHTTRTTHTGLLAQVLC